MKDSRSSLPQPKDLSKERHSQTPEKVNPLDYSGNNSVTALIQTLLPQQNVDENDENLSATVLVKLCDLNPVLNAGAYYTKLDMIEMRTAEICGLTQGPLNLDNATNNELEEVCDRCINAFKYMQSEGLCGEEISIVIEDRFLPDIAHTVRLSLNDMDWRPVLSSLISSPSSHMWEQASILERNPLGKYLTSLGFQPSTTTVAKTMCAINAIGLLSFSGSHVCRFDTSVWGQEIGEIHVGAGLSFRRRELTCLRDSIEGPIWVLGGKSGPSMEPLPRLKISLLVQDLQDLWGPAWLVGRTPEGGKIIRTERGYIFPLPKDQQHTQFTGIECHWTESLEEIPESNDQILLNSTCRILIGADMDNSLGLVFNAKCKPEASIQRFQSCVTNSYSMSGTQDAFYSWEDHEFQLGIASQYGPTANFTVKHKRHPKKSMKETIISEYANTPCDDRVFLAILRLRIGLEISLCTGNTQRRSLWDVLRLSYTEVGGSFDTSCSHEVGDLDCVRICWTRLSKQNLCRDKARKTLVHAIRRLRHTGINQQGNLEAHWPFVGVPTNQHILSTKCNRWFNIIRDIREAATFAVMSQRCLEFLDREQEGLCSKLVHSNDFLYRQTCLLIHTLPNTRPPSKLQLLRSRRPPSLDPQICPFQEVSPGERFRLWNVSLKLKSKFEENQTAVLVYACVSSLNLSLRAVPDFRELINPELKIGKPVRVVIHSDELLGNESI
ncbi:hypothetical protein N7493_005313 [Penicillium malachiteum]|uniref:Uncharacterized protein n=1 Tax=Penicillium malachiteum TaxID=1324776 RepID=A0AAD6HMP7_9EURO|nr:hypothetical protein N7493_005313 [Penicillium malachiteum]